MTSGNSYSTIQLLENGDDSDDEILLQSGKQENVPDLQFQEFSTEPPVTTQLGVIEDSDDEEDDRKELLNSSKKSPSFWTFEYYQTFFDVDTHEVIGRIAHSMIPSRQNYLLTKIRPNPDLYGPFWICSTLVFTIAICGNLSSFFAREGGDSHFQSDFRLVSLSACVIFSYSWVLPALLWGYLLWRGNLRAFSFLEIVCVYGYSLAIFIPISILWIVPYDWLRWVLVLIGVIASGSVLTLTFWAALEGDNKKIAIATAFTIFLLHTLLAIGFKLYFFKSNKIHDALTTTAITSTLQSAAHKSTFAPFSTPPSTT